MILETNVLGELQGLGDRTPFVHSTCYRRCRRVLARQPEVELLIRLIPNRIYEGICEGAAENGAFGGALFRHPFHHTFDDGESVTLKLSVMSRTCVRSTQSTTSKGLCLKTLIS